MRVCFLTKLDTLRECHWLYLVSYLVDLFGRPKKDTYRDANLGISHYIAEILWIRLINMLE